MKKQIVAVVAGAVLALSLGACSGTSSSASGSASSSSTSSSSEGSSSTTSSDFDANKFYVAGTWVGGVEVTGDSPYGTTSGTETMVNVTPSDDGTVEVAPVSGHEDLLTGSGTWTGTESELTLTVDGKTIVLTVVDDITLTGNASDFGIDGFDEIKFVLY